MLNKKISTLVLTSIICSVSFSTFALSTEKSDEIRNLKEKPVKITQTINNEEINLEMKLKDDGNILIESSSNDESHTAIVNPNTLEMTLDGVPVDLWLEVDGERINRNQLNSVLPKEGNLIEEKTRSSWTPVYQSTYKLHYSDIVTTLLGVSTVVAGAVAAASLMGVAISISTIKGKVLAWASIVAVPGQFIPTALKGYIQYSLYRTKGKVHIPTNGIVYGWRYQNVRAIYNLKGKTFNKQLRSVGSWWA